MLPTKRAPTLRDVAAACGVSPYTVSVVMNGAKSNTRVSEATRKRIQDCARDLNYQPNTMAQGLVKQRTSGIGVLFSIVRSTAALANPYVSGVLQGIVLEAAVHDCAVVLHTDEWVSADVSAPRVRARRTDGTIIIAPLGDTDVVTGMAALGLPLVTISADPLTNPPGVPNVDVDNRTGVALAVDHLIALGHRRIAHLMGNGNVASVRIRRESFLEATARHGIAVREGHLVAGSYDGTGVVEALAPVLARPERPTALVAGNDRMATAALTACRRAGLAVPGDVSVVGFDDFEEAVAAYPALTTVRQPVVEVGREAVRQLRLQTGRENADDGSGQVRHVELPPLLIVRDSTAPPGERSND
jgi:LacI family transcriptional regulator